MALLTWNYGLQDITSSLKSSSLYCERIGYAHCPTHLVLVVDIGNQLATEAVTMSPSPVLNPVGDISC